MAILDEHPFAVAEYNLCGLTAIDKCAITTLCELLAESPVPDAQPEIDFFGVTEMEEGRYYHIEYNGMIIHYERVNGGNDVRILSYTPEGTPVH